MTIYTETQRVCRCDLCGIHQSRKDGLPTEWRDIGGHGDVCRRCAQSLDLVVDEVVSACGVFKVSATRLVEAVVISRSDA